MATLGTKLTRLRKNKGISQAEMALQLDVSQAAYNKWESDSSKPSVENLLKLCAVHDIEIGDLFDEATNDFSNSKFEGSNIVANHCPVINMNSPEMMQSVLKNQEEITKLITNQNILIETLIGKLNNN
ncbi:hypothetical protein IQ37_19425 [Chryseobacterium piperi]|uniref:HTH cro/C1-type domain-containing protein n=1 Tax=Chryseobacterium piperi TaxID=558152 RepID=A0A086A5M1_9FLAO|nr:helix-turn-helix transcriptional regulator [Chryseobacterium piperi]ASW76314.1 XRE family transcriptional regulator [Chryseobacterium piperi]KFF11985.1 hypothetical protein IQ37_19425 [Chryseobacterium piperi]